MAALNRPNVFKLRIGRGHYWLAAAALVGLGFLVDAVAPNSGGSVTLVPWLMIFAWRLHDFGRSGWWAVLFFVVVAAVMIAGVILGYDAYVYYLDGETSAGPPAPDKLAYLVALGGGALALNLGFMIWLGIRKGDAGENRYGLPLGAKRPAREPFDFT